MDLDFHDLLLTPSDILEHLFCGHSPILSIT